MNHQQRKSENRQMKIYCIILLLVVISAKISYAQSSTVEQKLSVVENSYSVGGSFAIEYQIKGTNLGAAATLASMNADLVYDSTIIRFSTGSNWLPSLNSANGYATYIQSNNSETGNFKAVRIVVFAPTLNEDGSGSAPGYNVEEFYRTIVKVNFIILDNTRRVTIGIKDVTNQVGLFTNAGNQPNTFDILNKTLSQPITVQDEPLPVLLASFNSSVNGRNVKLDWLTNSEINNTGFEIERKSLAENWKKIGFVAGSNNSNSQKSYTFTDVKLETGKYNYRLKQLDNNGNFQYHNLNSLVEVGIPSKFNVSQNYPNPFNPTTKIDFEIPGDSKVTIKIYDISGKEISTVVNNEFYSSGYHTIQFNASNLSSGTYIYTFTIKSNEKQFVDSKKMTLIK